MNKEVLEWNLWVEPNAEEVVEMQKNIALAVYTYLEAPVVMGLVDKVQPVRSDKRQPERRSARYTVQTDHGFYDLRAGRNITLEG